MATMDGIRRRIASVVASSGLSASRFAKEAGLGRGTVAAIVRGQMTTVTLGTLETISAFAKVPMEYLILGRDTPEASAIADEIGQHADPSFPAAARGFLELEGHSEIAISVVREFLRGRFNPRYAWTPREWFDALSEEHRRRARGLHLVAAPDH